MSVGFTPTALTPLRNGEVYRTYQPSADMNLVPEKVRSSVIIVDDDSWLRLFVRKVTEDLGYRVLEASSAAEARDMLQKEPVELLITDIMMPEEPGFSLIANARQQFPGLKVLAVSGVDTGHLRLACRLGAHATLEKPLTPESLTKSLRYLLSSNDDPSIRT
jgi:DNA-binding response OmpR family regulator